MGELAKQKGLSTLLKLDPEKVCYASSNRAVGEWNLLVIDKLVKDAVDHLPIKPSKITLKEYGLLKERLKKISEQFLSHNYDHAPIARHIETLTQKLEPFKKEVHPLLEKTLEHALTRKIFASDQLELQKEGAQKFIRQLVGFFDRYLIPAMSHLKTYEHREVMRELLKKIVDLKENLDHLDVEGLLEESIIQLVKHFLFNAVENDRIYYNLLHYKEGSLDLSDLASCQKAANSINAFILFKLIPFIEDPDIVPCCEEIIKIYWNLSKLNQEFIAKHSKEGALLFPSLQAIEKLI